MTMRSELIINIKDEIWILTKYGMVGLSNTLVFAGSVLLLSKTGLGYMYYTAIGYIIAITYSFIMNLTFTFSRFPGPVMPRAVKFVGTAVSLMAIAEVVQFVLIENVGLREFFGIVIGMVVYTSAGFLINRLWVFR